MKIKNENYRKGKDSLILNTENKNQNNKGKIDNLITYQKNNYERMKKRKENKKKERRNEKTYKFCSGFLKSICFVYITICNFTFKKKQITNENINLDENKSNKNHEQNKNYILLNNKIIHKNYLTIIIIIIINIYSSNKLINDFSLPKFLIIISIFINKLLIKLKN